MKNINLLFSQDFILDYFNKNILPAYPNFTFIQNIQIINHKKFIWKKSHHIVTQYKTTFSTKKNTTKTISIFATSHSKESRKIVHQSLEFLWKNNFNDPKTTIPKTLYYSESFNTCFYEGINGPTLYQLIRDHNIPAIKKLLPTTALWFSKLHALKHRTKKHQLKKSTIPNVIPGIDHILNTIKNSHPNLLADYKLLFNHFTKTESNHLKQLNSLNVVHGDAHPENIIKINEDSMGVIDFTDLCLTDFARDLGTFTQQLEYMTNRKINNKAFSLEFSKIFLDHYMLYAKINLDSNLASRIENYYNWTTIRTATFFLTQGKLMTLPEYKEKALKLIKETKEKINS